MVGARPYPATRLRESRRSPGPRRPLCHRLRRLRDGGADARLAHPLGLLAFIGSRLARAPRAAQLFTSMLTSTRRPHPAARLVSSAFTAAGGRAPPVIADMVRSCSTTWTVPSLRRRLRVPSAVNVIANSSAFPGDRPVQDPRPRLDPDLESSPRGAGHGRPAASRFATTWPTWSPSAAGPRPAPAQRPRPARCRRQPHRRGILSNAALLFRPASRPRPTSGQRLTPHAAPVPNPALVRTRPRRRELLRFDSPVHIASRVVMDQYPGGHPIPEGERVVAYLARQPRPRSSTTSDLRLTRIGPPRCSSAAASTTAWAPAGPTRAQFAFRPDGPIPRNQPRRRNSEQLSLKASSRSRSRG